MYINSELYRDNETIIITKVCDIYGNVVYSEDRMVKGGGI